MPRTFHHAALAVADVDASIRWYADVLGFTVERRFYLPDPGIDIAYLVDAAGTRIELLHQTGRDTPPPAGLTDLLATGAHHLCFEVDDLEAAAAELRRRGARFFQEPQVVEAAGVKNFWITDDTGSPIEFIEVLG